MTMYPERKKITIRGKYDAFILKEDGRFFYSFPYIVQDERNQIK